MAPIFRFLFPTLWLGWGVFWWLAANNVKPFARRESLPSRLLHMLPLFFAGALLWPRTLPLPWLGARFLPPSLWPFWLGALLAIAGLLFTVWARLHLGRNWSGFVTIKQEHELITSGPYAIVRHPIYTGLLLAFAGSALARGEWRGCLALFIVLAALWRKLRLEERWMREQFGPQYEAYSHRVAALIPFLL